MKRSLKLGGLLAGLLCVSYGCRLQTRTPASRALEALRERAEQGNAEAQLGLGVIYATGQKVPQDYREAVKWFRRAADQGNAVAQRSLGVMYDDGRGVPRDSVEALKWYRLAAGGKDVIAQLALGQMYRDGEGVPQDYKEAAKWFRLAAEGGNVEAQQILGLMYMNGGPGFVRNDQEATKWLRLSAEQGKTLSQQLLAARDDKESAKWYRLAAEQGGIWYLIIGLVCGYAAFAVGKWRNLSVLQDGHPWWGTSRAWRNPLIRYGSWLFVAVMSLLFAASFSALIRDHLNGFVGRFSFGTLLVFRWWASVTAAKRKGFRLHPDDVPPPPPSLEDYRRMYPDDDRPTRP